MVLLSVRQLLINSSAPRASRQASRQPRRGRSPAGRVSVPNGFAGGAQIGYNLQLNRGLVGVETDIDGVGARGHEAYGQNDVFSNGTPAGTFSLSTRVDNSMAVDWLGTLRGRLGLFLHPDILAHLLVAWPMARQAQAPSSISNGLVRFSSCQRPRAPLASSTNLWSAGLAAVVLSGCLRRI